MKRGKKIMAELEDRAAGDDQLRWRMQHDPMGSPPVARSLSQAGAQAAKTAKGPPNEHMRALEPVNADLPDANGNRGSPRFRAVDVEVKLFRQGVLTAEHVAAAGRFRQDFHSARLDPRRAFDPAPKIRCNIDPTELGEDAKRRVHFAIEAVGGQRSEPGFVLGWIIGAGIGMEECGRRLAVADLDISRTPNPRTVSGIFTAMLSALAAHYRHVDRFGYPKIVSKDTKSG